MYKEWFDSDDVKEPGWYAIHYCWDASEGSFISTAYFDGAKFDRRLPLFDVAGPFMSEKEADEWAEKNDISS